MVLAGEGEFLARRVLARRPDLAECPVVTLSEWLRPELSRAACAYAVAVLGAEG